MRRLAPMFAASLLVLGCATGGGRSDVPAVLEGTTWRIVQVNGQPVPAGNDVNLAPHLLILSAEGKVYGATGCNRFSGPYRSDGTHVTFGPLATTRTTCRAPAGQARERTILEALQAVDGYQIEGRWLWLSEGADLRITAEVWR